MNLIYLQPTDVLFFRDGRPMSGSLAGHTAAWPLPDVTNHALHAALHRADFETATSQKLHTHRRGRSGNYSTVENECDRKFGSLLTAGPFPVLDGTGNVPVAPGNLPDGPRWFFPRPKDAQLNGSVQVTHRPLRSLAADGNDDPWIHSSLPDPLEYAVVNTEPPSKEAGGEPWISADAFAAYLSDSRPNGPATPTPDPTHLLRDTDLADTEHQIGIGINLETGTTAESQFYSAHYLRLREKVRLGLIARAEDKAFQHPVHGNDLIRALLNGRPEQIIVGGQQRLCTAHRENIPAGGLPLPAGLKQAADFTLLSNGKFAVKWILLSPAIWPKIPGGTSKSGDPINAHPGGWLPNWVFLDWDEENRAARRNDRNGRVMLKLRSGKLWRDYSGPRVRRVADGEADIAARLVTAIIPKPVVVTGWAMGVRDSQSEISNLSSGIRATGAKSTQLAVPAGAVYYFEAEPDQDGGPGNAVALAAALNWHGGAAPSTTIKNRRSTLMGEKGFGLGVCGTWKFFENVR